MSMAKQEPVERQPAEYGQGAGTERLARIGRWLAASSWREHAPLLLALLPALVVALPLLRETPLSYDHATHLFKGWHFWEEMLPQGRLRGWSYFWAFGFPSDELVPCGGEIWIALFRAATFGQLSWLQTYSLAFAGFLLFKTAANYYFARGFYLGQAAAVACAWISIIDPGGMLEGGWTWHTFWGVWPVSLAMSFAQLSMVRLERILSGGGVRDVFAAGAWLGAALLTHQMALPMFAIVAPLLVLDHLVRKRKPALADVVRLGLSLGFAVALASFFLVPFLARSRHTQDLGWLGESLPVVTQKFFELSVFQNVPAAIHGVSLLGAWFALRRRSPGALFLAAASALFVVLASGTLLRDLHLERVMPSLIKLEANRFLLIAKLFWFPLGGYALVSLAAPCLPSKASWLRLPPAARWAGGAALAGLLLVGGYVALSAIQKGKNYVGQDERKHWKDFPALLDWTRQERASTDEHYRIAYEMWRGDHLSTIAPVFDHTLMYKVGSTPTQIYDKIPMTHEAQLLEALSVKYLVSSYPLNWPTMELERQFGELWVYRFKRYRPEPFLVLGAGQAELLEFSPERLRIRLSGTSRESRLRIHVASYDRWQATSGGEVLPISTVPALGIEYPMLMEVPARDGELVLDYVYRAPDWLGLLLSLGALPGFALAAWGNRRFQLLPRLCAALAGAARPIAWGAALAGVAAVVYVAAATRSRERLLPRDSIFRLVKDSDLLLDGEPCTLEAPLSFHCGWQELEADVVAGVWGLHLCMTAPSASELRLRVQATLGSFLAGHYDPREKGEGHIRVAVDGQELGAIATRPSYLRHQKIQLDTRERRAQPATIEVSLSGAALHCFDLSIVK